MFDWARISLIVAPTKHAFAADFHTGNIHEARSQFVLN
jgi:hypothetical protein